MKHARFLLAFVSICLAGCIENISRQNYDQYYKKFDDFNIVNERNKSWFPHIISRDAYDLRNSSYLDSLCAFGSFSYLRDDFYDSTFASTTTKKINISLFNQKLNEHIKRKPSWFLKSKAVDKTKFEAIQLDRFYITRDKLDKKIYFILSN